VTGYHECDKELLASIICGEFLDYCRNHQLSRRTLLHAVGWLVT
jgi:hypothetical protein